MNQKFTKWDVLLAIPLVILPTIMIIAAFVALIVIGIKDPLMLYCI